MTKDQPAIGIDGFNLSLPEGTGVATYGFGLAKTVASMGHSVTGLFGLAAGAKEETRELLFFEHFGRGNGKWNRKALRSSVVRWFGAPWRWPRCYEIPQSGLVETRSFGARLPKLDRILSSPHLFAIASAHFRIFGRFLDVRIPNPPAIMHWTYPLPVRLVGAKNVYTLHDLVPLRLPYTTQDDKKYYHKLVAACVANGDAICTVSDASKADILMRWPEAEPKTYNTYQISPVPSEVTARSIEENAAIIKSQFNLDFKEYFLFFGAIDPKKNISRIIDGYLTANVRTPLVMVTSGDKTEKEGKSLDSPFRRKLDERILVLEYLPKATLHLLIQGAKAVVFPSLFEGFGLPALEAIQLGTPVISSDVSSLPEVIGDAGLLIDPYQTAQIADAIKAVDADADLRDRLVAAGPAQLEKFSPECYQTRLGAMYGSLIAK